jgi:hypothetical protein
MSRRCASGKAASLGRILDEFSFLTAIGLWSHIRPSRVQKKGEVLLGKLIHILENCRQMKDRVAITYPVHR